MHLGIEYKIKHIDSNTNLEKETVVTINQVDNLYVGKGNSCRCGCGGDYIEVDENERAIEKSLRQMSSGEYEVRSIEDYIFEIITSVNGNYERVKTLYLKK
jgi:hypothetical protein